MSHSQKIVPGAQRCGVCARSRPERQRPVLRRDSRQRLRRGARALKSGGSGRHQGIPGAGRSSALRGSHRLPEMMRELLQPAPRECPDQFRSDPADVVRGGDLAKARLLVEKGADVNARSKMGHTARTSPRAAGSSRRCATSSITAPAVQARDELGMTPLLRAVIADDSAMAGLLLEKGDDPKMADGGGRTPLMFAAGAGNVELVKLLLAKGSDVNAQSMPSFGPGVKNGPIAIGSLTPLTDGSQQRQSRDRTDPVGCRSKSGCARRPGNDAPHAGRRDGPCQ